MTNKQKAQQMIMKLSQWLQTEEVLDNVMSDKQEIGGGLYKFSNGVISDDVRVSVEINIEAKND